jgi:hypothetical protein
MLAGVDPLGRGEDLDRRRPDERPAIRLRLLERQEGRGETRFGERAFEDLETSSLQLSCDPGRVLDLKDQAK